MSSLITRVRWPYAPPVSLFGSRRMSTAAIDSLLPVSEDSVFAGRREAVGHIVLNRTKALNAIDLAMVRDIRSQMAAFARDKSVGSVLIRGMGEKAFCAGGDVRSLYDEEKKGAGRRLRTQFFFQEYAMNYEIATMNKPWIALMDGITSKIEQFRTITI